MKSKSKKKKTKSTKPINKNWEVHCLECDEVITLPVFLLGNGECQICCENKFVDIIIAQDHKKKVKKEKSTMNLETLGIPKELWLPDNGIYTNRFNVKSDNSDNVYIVSLNNSNNVWGCSCPGWKRTRKCKHLKKLGLCEAKVNNFASGYSQNANIPTAGELRSNRNANISYDTSEMKVTKRKITLDD